MNMCTKLAVLVALALICGCGGETVDKCGEDVGCIEKSLVGLMDEMDSEGRIQVAGDFFTLEKTGQSEGPRTEDFWGRLARFVGDRQMSFKVPTNEEEAGRMVEEARKSKLRKILLPLILLLKLKGAIILPAIISGIALVAFKGLGASLIAMIIAGATAFKSVLEGHSHSKVTYEVVPQISHSHWSRSGVAGIENYPIPGYHTIADY